MNLNYDVQERNLLMKKHYNVLILVALTTALISCSGESNNSSESDHNPGPYYVEFVSCEKGSDYSKESLTSMIKAWRALAVSDDLRGSFLYEPLNDGYAFGNSMWWELEWEDKNAADNAWNDWQGNEETSSWAEEYSKVLNCDGEGRNAWDILVPISSQYFDGSNDSGYFYSQYWNCSYKDNAGRQDLENFLPLHSAKIKSSPLEGTGYHYGVYFDRRSEQASHSEVDVAHIWGEWASSREAMEIQNKNFSDNFQDVFEEFDKIGSCADSPDTYDSWVLYLRGDRDSMPVF